MSKYTPGPWECKDSPEAPFDGQFRVLGPYFPGKTPEKGFFDCRPWLAYFDNFHDAKLAAAGPEMLTALEVLVELIDSGQLVRDISRDHEPGFAMKMLKFVPKIKQAVDAIAKAKGEG